MLLTALLSAALLVAPSLVAAAAPKIAGVTVPDITAVAVPDKTKHRVHCTVRPNGPKKDDVPKILKAFEKCGTNGYVLFPEGETYNISSFLHLTLNDVIIDWRGTWQFSDNLTYWRANSFPIAFQNHHAGFIISGNDIQINGYGTGGINGNGNAWYNVEQKVTQPGRPMPFVWWNVSDVTVSGFSVIDPPLWSINIMNGTNMWFDQMYVNATAVNVPFGTNWVQNTDGFDTMDANNIQLTNFVYQGGDDCIAIKPRSYNIKVENVTCHGGNGIAIGSLGQYLEDSSVNNVWVDKVNIVRYNNDMENGAYLKTWIGVLVNQSSYESNYQPRGGGWGTVSDILFSNFNLMGPSLATAITQDSGDNGTVPGTSLMTVSNVAFVNFTGYINSTGSSQKYRVGEVSCSKVHPCYNIEFQNYTIANNQSLQTTTCAYVAPGGVQGLNCTT